MWEQQITVKHFSVEGSTNGVWLGWPQMHMSEEWLGIFFFLNASIDPTICAGGWVSLALSPLLLVRDRLIAAQLAQTGDPPPLLILSYIHFLFIFYLFQPHLGEFGGLRREARVA